MMKEGRENHKGRGGEGGERALRRNYFASQSFSLLIKKWKKLGNYLKTVLLDVRYCKFFLQKSNML